MASLVKPVDALVSVDRTLRCVNCRYLGLLGSGSRTLNYVQKVHITLGMGVPE